jgi:predicted N-acyltransferase
VAEALYRIRRAERLSGQTDLMMLKDFPESDPTPDPELRPFRYRALETEPDMALAIPEAWKSYEDYLAGLVAKPRSSIKKIHRDVEERGFKVETVSSLAGLEQELHALYLKTHHKAKIRIVTVPEGYLAAVARAAGLDFRCTVIREGGRIVGFGACIKDGPVAVGYHVGVDPDANAKAPIYHRLLHGMIEQAILFGCRSLSFGRTALEAKANLGAKPVPLRVLIRHRQPVMNAVVQAVLKSVHHDEAPVRDLMKK